MSGTPDDYDVASMTGMSVDGVRATRSPYMIDGPASISFSGGRTSAFMLRRILDAHGGALPADVHVLFANTGKERPETLDFIHECETLWTCRVRWLEYEVQHDERGAHHRYREVGYATAARNGEPFTALTSHRGYTPNPVHRSCTQELKIRPMTRFMRDCGYDEWDVVIGLRADEPRRVAKTRMPLRERYTRMCPLADAGVTLSDITAFWAASSFDLQLESHEGNCDLCFLKGRKTIERIMRARPDLADWWIERERALGNQFRIDRPAYVQLLAGVRAQPFLPGLGDEDALPCACTD